MKVPVVAVMWCLAVMWGGAMGRTPECCCGYGTFCLDFGEGDGPVDLPCERWFEACKKIGASFYSPSKTDCNTLENHCKPPTGNPCSRGKCVPIFGSYFCDCPAGWYGQKCDIKDPHLESEGVKNPVYIYYQVQTDKKGERIPFHLIYDPGPQSGIMKPSETGVKIQIKLNDGRWYYPMRRAQFNQLNVKEICLRDANANPDLFDIRVCDFVPGGVHWVFKFDPKLSTYESARIIGYDRNNNGVPDFEDIMGEVGNVDIQIVYMLNGKPKHTLYESNLPLFTYYKSKVLNKCHSLIEFDGCGADDLKPKIYLRSDPVKIKTSVQSRNCDGIRNIGTKWLLQRGVGFEGEYDPVPYELDFGDSRSIKFEPRFFTDGKHMIEIEVTRMGDPPHYGGPTVYQIYQRCFIEVKLGPLIVQAKGGNRVSSSCQVNLEIDLESLNPGILISEMVFIMKCRRVEPDISELDVECKERKTEVPMIRKLDTPCNTVYEYSITVIHFISKPVTQELKVMVHFVLNHVRLTITCLFNCYPIDPLFRSIIVASTDPYVPASIKWKVVAGDRTIDESQFEPTIRAFLPLDTSRVLRIDGQILQTPGQTLTKVTISASVIGNEELRASIETVTNDIFIELSKFIPVVLEPGEGVDYKTVRYDKREGTEVEFAFEPVEYRFLLADHIIYDNLQLRASSYLPVRGRLESPLNQLCATDAMKTSSCTELEYLERIDSHTADLSRIEQLCREGNDVSQLYETAIFFVNGLWTLQFSPIEGVVMTSIKSNTERAKVMELALQTKDLRETEVQTITFILTRVFLSKESNEVQDLPVPYEDAFDKQEYFHLTTQEYRDWMKVRILGLKHLHRITEWALEYGKEAERSKMGQPKLIRIQYGDSLEYVVCAPAPPQKLEEKLCLNPNLQQLLVFIDYCWGEIAVQRRGIIRCWNLAHAQGSSVIRFANKLSHNEVLDAQLHIINLENSKRLMRTLSLFLKTLFYYSRLFYGIRDIGRWHTRVWMVRTTYQGILAAFNKSNTGETLLGYSDHIFGPVHREEQWLGYTNLKLPDLDEVAELMGRELVLVVGIVGNRPRDASISPTLLLSLTGRNSGPYNQLPGGMEYAVTLPILIDGVQANLSSKQLFTTELLRPSNDSDKFKYYSVYKVILPNEFAVWDLRMVTDTETPLKVIVSFDALPDYAEVVHSKPLRPTFKKSVNSFIIEHVVQPLPPDKAIPRYFYFGLLLTEYTLPDTWVTVKVRNTVDTCWLQDLDMNESEKTCKGKQKGESLTIDCFCNEFGFINARANAIRITKILMTPIELVVTESFSAVQLTIPLFLLVLVIVLTIFAILMDKRRRKLDVLIPMEDTRPLDTYPLILGVFTSPNLMAGTSSTVAIKVEGRSSSSRVHLLKCKSRSTLKRASDDWFVLTTNQPLGKIQHVLLWHDYRCLSNWYCRYILIYDIKQENWYMASVNRWFRLHPTVDESRFAQIKTYKFGNVESGLKAIPGKFKDHLISEMHNSHYFISMFTLHMRCLYSVENRVLAFLIRLIAIFFGTWIAQARHILEDESEKEIGRPSLKELHFDINSFLIVIIIDAISFVFVIPYMLLVRSTSMSGLIQKKTTNPQNMDIIRKEQTTVGAEKKEGKKDKSQPDEKQQRSVLFQLDSTDRTESAQSWMVHKPGEEMQSKSKKQWTATHFQHSRLKKLLTLAFGPCQFRCVNVSYQIFDIKMRKTILHSRLLAWFLILTGLAFITYVEELTNFGAKYNITIYYVVLVTLIDFFILNPIVILLITFVMYTFLQTSNREYHLWGENVKLSLPKPLSFLQYFHTATKKVYKPLLSSDVEKVMKKSTIYHAIRICLLYAYVLLCMVIIVRILGSRYDKGYYLSVRTIKTATEQDRFSTGVRSTGLTRSNIEVVQPSNMTEDFIPAMFGELQYLWPNGEKMSHNKENLKIPKYFTKLFSHAYGFLSESKLENSPIVLADKQLNYSKVNQFHRLRGNSRSNYALVGNQAIIPTAEWKEYYISLTTILADLNRRNDLVPRAVIISYNIVTANTIRLGTVDLVVEFMPSGECSALVHVASTKVRSSQSTRFMIWRGLVIVLALAHFAIAVVDISTMGFKSYITHWYGITKVVLSASGVIVSMTTVFFYFPKFQMVDKLFNYPKDKYLDLHGVHDGELLDSSALALFLLVMCVDFAVAVKDALGLRILSAASTKGFPMSLKMLLIIMIYSRAAATSANVFAISYDFMVAFFFKAIFPLAGKADENETFFIAALTIMSVFSKFVLAIFIYNFECYDENYVSDYHPGRSAAVLMKLKPLRATTEVKMQYIKKHSVYVGKPSAANVSVVGSVSQIKSKESRSRSPKSKSSTKSESQSMGERKLEARASQLDRKMFIWF